MGLVLISPEKLTIEKSLKLGFSTMNNEAEYKALLEGMSMVQRMEGSSKDVLILEAGYRSGEGRTRNKR